MAYKVIILYQLYMPSYFLGTFTEYPFLGTDPSLKSNSYKILLFIVFLAIHQYFIDTGSVHVDNLEFQLVPGDFLAGMGDVFQ